MTAVFNGTRSSPPHLPAELIDRLDETVMLPPDPHARSVAIAGLVTEMFETIRWFHGSDPDPEELASMYRVLAEAYAHRSRMAAAAKIGSRR